MLGWMAAESVQAYQAAATNGDGGVYGWFRSEVLGTLAKRGFVTTCTSAGANAPAHADPTVTASVRRIMDAVRRLCSVPVRDGATRTYPDGLVATEFIVAAIMVDGRSVAADVLSRCSRGLVNALTLLRAIEADPTKVLPAPATAGAGFAIGAPAGGAPVQEPWEPPMALPSVASGRWAVPGVPYANWVIEDRLMIGETPGGDSYHTASSSGPEMEAIIAELVPAHVDTFVCLRGEWGPSDVFASSRYPAAAASAGLPCTTLFFPIEDFHVTHEADVVALVLELRRRLRAGERLYIHCRSGHGRTGMIVIPLVASLFDVTVAEATTFVQAVHDVGRNGGQDAGWSLPEMMSQRDLVAAVEAQVRRAELGPGGATASGSRGR